MIPISSVCFDRKLLFSTWQNLAAERSRCSRTPLRAESETERRPAPLHVDVWSIQAPDFSPKLYRSLSGPRSEAGFKGRAHALSSGVSPTEKSTGRDVSRVLHVKRVVAEVLRESDGGRRPRRFTTSYKPPDALQAELMFVKLGKFPPLGPYRNPKPHDFRPQDDDLPNMTLVSKKDPGNLEFKLNHRDILRTTRSESALTSRDTTKTMIKMDTYKPAEPTWDLRLLLPNPQWPLKSASYTRHRRSRTAYSAFMERVEEKLSRSWWGQ